jgi:hypothetical protein
MAPLVAAILWPTVVGFQGILLYGAFILWLKDRRTSNVDSTRLTELADEISKIKDRLGPIEIAKGLRNFNAKQ